MEYVLPERAQLHNCGWWMVQCRQMCADPKNNPLRTMFAVRTMRTCVRLPLAWPMCSYFSIVRYWANFSTTIKGRSCFIDIIMKRPNDNWYIEFGPFSSFNSTWRKMSYYATNTHNKKEMHVKTNTQKWLLKNHEIPDSLRDYIYMLTHYYHTWLFYDVSSLQVHFLLQIMIEICLFFLISCQCHIHLINFVTDKPGKLWLLGRLQYLPNPSLEIGVRNWISST